MRLWNLLDSLSMTLSDIGHYLYWAELGQTALTVEIKSDIRKLKKSIRMMLKNKALEQLPSFSFIEMRTEEMLELVDRALASDEINDDLKGLGDWIKVFSEDIGEVQVILGEDDENPKEADDHIQSFREEYELLMAGAKALASERENVSSHKLDRVNRSLHWFGESFEAIDQNPFDVIAVLYDAFTKGVNWVSLDELRNRCSGIATIQTEYSKTSKGLAEVFTVRVFDKRKKRRVRTKLDVWKIVDVKGRSAPFYRLKSPSGENPD